MNKLFAWLTVLLLLLSLTLSSCQISVSDPNEKDTTPNGSTADESTTDTNGEPQNGCGGTDRAHTDEDNDGLCDACSQSVVIVLDLFAINDLHGKLCDTSTQAGVDEMTTYLKRIYENEEHVIVLSSGDMWQGSSESNLTKGQIVTEWMNELDIVSMTLGNHEYDWGEEYILQNAALAEFPFLAINVYDVDTNARVEYCQPSVMVERGGAQIGIIGAIGDCYSSISGDMSGGVYFQTGSDLTALVKAEAQRLRDEGADFIVYSIHDGYGRSSSGVSGISDSNLRSYYDPALSEGVVDIVFEGHSHQNYVLRDADGVYHMQGGGDNRGISHAEAVINFANGSSRVQAAEFISSSVYAQMSDDPIVDALMQKYDEQVSVGTRVIGSNDFFRGSDELCELIASLYVEAGEEEFGTAYDIVLGGGYLSVRSPYNLPAGQVTYAQLQMLFPFDNDLVLCSIKGADLKSRFIESTHENYFVSYSDYGASIKDRIDPNATYYVIVDTYSSTYAPNRLTEIQRFRTGTYARDLLAAYVKAGGMSAGQTDIVYTPIASVLQIGAGLADNAATAQGYYVKGRVALIDNTTYGNLYLEDADGNRLFVYGVYDATGATRYDALPQQPRVGDEVVLFAPIKRFVKQGSVTIELLSARLIEIF